jgi:RNA polymerase sigma-70 factor (ECF subfamily)
MVTMPASPLALELPSDAAVIGRVRAGELEAFALLVERYRARCVRLARRLLADPDEADDAVQDAFIRAYRSLDRYEERERFGAWLLCIVANRCHSASASAARRARVAGDWWHAQRCLAGESTRPADADPALAARLAAALDALPAPTRDAVVQRYAHELSYEEIAGRTGVGVSALKMRVSRGSAQLRRALVTAGITAAAVAAIVLVRQPRDRTARPAAAIACDTLRTLMHDTLASPTHDSVVALPARCSDPATNATVAARPRARPALRLEQRIR